MRVRNIALNAAEMPETVTVELTIREAAFIATLLGGMNSIQADQAVPGFVEEFHATYAGLSHALFNRFYEEGVEGAIADLR